MWEFLWGMLKWKGKEFGLILLVDNVNLLNFCGVMLLIVEIVENFNGLNCYIFVLLINYYNYYYYYLLEMMICFL